MLKAGADLSGKTMEQLISLDAKEFQMGNAKVEIAQVNAVDTNDVLVHQAELEKVISAVVEEKGLDLFLFVVTDILTNDSVGLAIGNAANVVEKAYNVSLENNTATLKGVVSRKKTNRTSINRSIPSLILLSTDRKGQVVGLATCLFYLQKTEDSIF